MCAVLSCSVVSLCDLMDYSPPGSSVYGGSPGKNTGVDCHALLQGCLPSPGIKPRSCTLQVDSLPSLYIFCVLVVICLIVVYIFS